MMEMKLIVCTPDAPKAQSEGDHSWMYRDEAVAALHECDGFDADGEPCIVCAELARQGIIKSE